MYFQLKYVLLLIAFAIADEQIKLEDIERDNLLSERSVNRDERLSAPIHAGPQYEVKLTKAFPLQPSEK